MPTFPIKVGTEGVGKGLEKLADLGKSLGVLAFGPSHRVRMAKADAEALLIQTGAEVEVENIRQRAAYRLTQEAIRNQENIEAVYQEAVRFLPRQISDEPVSQDWASKFNDRARFASDQELRTVWARVLASEVAKPNSVSPRTVALIDTMTGNDAKALESLLACAASVTGENEEVLFLVRAARGSTEESNKSIFGVEYTTFENLRASGFVSAADDSHVGGSEGESLELLYDTIRLQFRNLAGSTTRLPIHLLTEPCRQIALALRVPPNQGFLDRLCEWAPTVGLSVSSPL